jgi:hypothetical protein
MSDDAESEFEFTPYKINKSDHGVSAPIEVISLDEIILNVHEKYAYPELQDFVTELNQINKLMCIGNRTVSTLHLYVLKSTGDPIDMSNQTVRRIYRPSLFIRKNDAFGPWNFNYLLDLLEIDYQCPNNDEFPKIWKTTDQTEVTVNIIHSTTSSSAVNTTTITSNTKVDTTAESTTLFGVLKQICRQNKYDEADATIWLRNLKGE